MDLHLVSNIDRHQVFAENDFAAVCSMRTADYIKARRWRKVAIGREQHHVSEYGKFRLYPREYSPGVFRRCMETQDSASNRRRRRFFQKLGSNRCHFMKQYVGTGGMADQIIVGPGVAGDRHRMAGVVHPITERRLKQPAVIHKESRHLHTVAVVDNSLVDIVCDNFDSCRRQLFPFTPYMDIPLICLAEIRHHVPCANGSPYL